MKMRTINTILAAGLLCGMGSVQAEDEGLGIGVGAKFGTLGYGLDLSKNITDNFNVRIGMNQYSLSDTDTQDDVKYDMELDWNTLGLFADYHPFGGTFRLTLGYVNNSNKISMSAVPTATYDIGGSTYTAAEIGSLAGDVTFGNGLFYGLGWGNAAKGKGFGFSFEAGIMQQEPDLNLDLNLTAVGQAAHPTAAQDVAAEEKKAQDDLDDFNQYPVIALGISYGF